VANKLAAQGIKLSAGERKKLNRFIKEGRKDTFRTNRWKFWDQRQIHVDFTPEEIKQAEQKLADFIDNNLNGLVRSVASDISGKILGDLKRKWRAESRRQKREASGFAQRLNKQWGVPIERLRMLLTISRELGASINDRVRNSSQSNDSNLIEVLTRSHARACQIAEEIICLLAAGFADGAMARWRTLHEVAVIALFISDNGEQLAERYVLHQQIEARKGANEYAKYEKRLGIEKIDTGTIESLEKAFTALKTRFGKDFANSYGWASSHLKISDPSFVNIERAVGVDHLRPYYRMASHNIHANPKGVFFKLGLMQESDILLAGPSNAGLSDPGQGAAISLAQVSTTLFNLHPNFDNLVALQIIMQVVEEIGEAFAQAHSRLEEDAERFGASVKTFTAGGNVPSSGPGAE
jgi:hypothetical protein